MWAKHGQEVVGVDINENVVQCLEKYIIADDVTLEPNLALHRYYLCTNSATASIPGAEIYESKRWGINGWEVWSTKPLDFSHFPKLSQEILDIFRIENIVPSWDVDFNETYLPQEALWSEHVRLIAPDHR
jgi:hypothetical protein